MLLAILPLGLNLLVANENFLFLSWSVFWESHFVWEIVMYKLIRVKEMDFGPPTNASLSLTNTESTLENKVHCGFSERHRG